MLKLINNLPIDTQHIEEGIDRKQLNVLRQRFLQINQTRFDRSMQALTERQQQFLKLILSISLSLSLPQRLTPNIY